METDEVTDSNVMETDEVTEDNEDDEEIETIGAKKLPRKRQVWRVLRFCDDSYTKNEMGMIENIIDGLV